MLPHLYWFKIMGDAESVHYTVSETLNISSRHPSFLENSECLCI